MNNFKTITINKNRGWRGLAEAHIQDDDNNLVLKMIFSFSPAVWYDMLHGYMVLQDNDYYYVIDFDNLDRLPRPTQQRSVLIKNFRANVINVNRYEKATWNTAEGKDWSCIMNFLKNRNNHTTSDWNCIGIRVIPTII